MVESDRVNEILKVLGSSYRAHSGDMVNNSILAILEAIPAYIHGEIEKAERKKHDEMLKTLEEPYPLKIEGTGSDQEDK